MLTLRYDGADKHIRTTTIQFDPPPASFDQATATYRLELAPQTAVSLQCIIYATDEQPPGILGSGWGRRGVVRVRRGRPH